MHHPDPATPSEGHSSGSPWRIELFGACTAANGDRRVTRFPSRPVALLLARLALSPRRDHPREELIELLWPGVALDVGRNRLRQTLSTLRSLLEKPRAGATPLLHADRRAVRLDAGRMRCDVLEFETAVRRRDADTARKLYRGELLPGYYDNWVVEERLRLEALLDRLARDDSAPGSPTADPEPSYTALPSYLSSFLGREADLARLQALLRTDRLVTLHGPGGCGKTRLAVEAARRAEGWDDIVFVGLAECSSAAQWLDRVRAALRWPPRAVTVEQIADALEERRVLWVFDNFEQLVAGGAGTQLQALLGAMPGAHAIVTSRRVLGIAGEREMPLAPLDLPAPDDPLDALARNPAVALFVDRARSVKPDLRITEAERADLHAVALLLEGLPLAIEIAASRLRGHGLPEMRQALQARLALLVRVGPTAAAHGRHASLRAASDWSWQLLDEPDRAFIAALTVFRGGWSADDARAVTGDADAHARLEALVADALITVRAAETTNSPDDAASPARAPEATRFGMLDAIREFVVEQLPAERAAELRRAHRAHQLALALAFAASRATGAAALPDAAIPNVVAALESGLADDEPETTATIALALKLQWEFAGTPPDALAAMTSAAARIASTWRDAAALQGMLARLLIVAGDADAAAASAARALAAAGNDPERRSEALFAATRVAWIRTLDVAATLAPAEECLRLARQAGARALEASALSLLAAITLWGLERPADAEPLYAEAESIYLSLGNRSGALQSSHGRLGCQFHNRQYAEVIAAAGAIEAQAEALGNIEARLAVLDVVKWSHIRLRRSADALATARSAARLARRHHKVYNLVHALTGQGLSLARLRRPEDAARVEGFARRFWIEHLGTPGPDDVRAYTRVRRLIGVQIGQGQADVLLAEGERMAMRDGLALCCDDDSRGAAPDPQSTAARPASKRRNAISP